METNTENYNHFKCSIVKHSAHGEIYFHNLSSANIRATRT